MRERRLSLDTDLTQSYGSKIVILVVYSVHQREVKSKPFSTEMVKKVQSTGGILSWFRSSNFKANSRLYHYDCHSTWVNNDPFFQGSVSWQAESLWRTRTKNIIHISILKKKFRASPPLSSSPLVGLINTYISKCDLKALLGDGENLRRRGSGRGRTSGTTGTIGVVWRLRGQ